MLVMIVRRNFFPASLGYTKGLSYTWRSVATHCDCASAPRTTQEIFTTCPHIKRLWPKPSTRMNEPVGICEGEIVGSAVGKELGKRVGEALGEIVGSAVGKELGKRVGEALGEIVGSAVGSGVGEPEGSGVGSAEGADDGKLVGSSVGE